MYKYLLGTLLVFSFNINAELDKNFYDDLDARVNAMSSSELKKEEPS